MRRTLTRHHGVRAKPLRTSICVDISCEEWSDSTADVFSFDARVQDAEARAGHGNTFVVRVSGPRRDLRRVSKQIFTRYQRFFQRRNAGSRSKLFTAVLQHRRAATPFEDPFARAGCEHALDVWQWVLRLDSDASTAVQLAALFHVAESGCPSCCVLPDEHELGLAANTWEAPLKAAALEGMRLPQELISEATSLIAQHQQGAEHARKQNDPDAILLHDADGLSFLSLGTPSSLSSSELNPTAHQIKQRVACLSARARSWIPSIRLSPLLLELLNDAFPAEEPFRLERNRVSYGAPSAANAP